MSFRFLVTCVSSFNLKRGILAPLLQHWGVDILERSGCLDRSLWVQVAALNALDVQFGG